MSSTACQKAADTPVTHEVIIVGAGITGLYALHEFRNAGHDVMVVEAGSEVGGTWYWNRYPGLRVDIESVDYSYGFSEPLQQEWRWPYRYSYRSDLLEYLKHVADKFDLRRSIRFDTRIVATVFDDDKNSWTLTSESGETFTARFVVMATGILSAPNTPGFPGLERYRGKQYHTARWPETEVDFSGERVAVIGTGSTGVQVIPEIAKQAAHLTVYQRTARFVIPSRNCPMPSSYEQRVKSDYRGWRQRQKESPTGFIAVNFEAAEWVTELALETPPEERAALYENRWRSGGLALYNVYPDIYTNVEANGTLAEFLRDKIRERIKDPKLHDKLVPHGFPVLTNRLCTDDGYYEVFEKDCVDLVDLGDSRIEMTEKGIYANGEERQFDSIVFATGYEAYIGAMKRMGIVGRDGRQLTDHWAEAVPTSLGLMVHGFPNMFMLNGPGAPTVLRLPFLMAEDQTRWVEQWIRTMHERGRSRLEPTAEFEETWLRLCEDTLMQTLFPMTKSWQLGANISGEIRHGLAYYGTVADYQARCENVLASDFEGFVVTD